MHRLVSSTNTHAQNEITITCYKSFVFTFTGSRSKSMTSPRCNRAPNSRSTRTFLVINSWHIHRYVSEILLSQSDNLRSQSLLLLLAGDIPLFLCLSFLRSDTTGVQLLIASFTKHTPGTSRMSSTIQIRRRLGPVTLHCLNHHPQRKKESVSLGSHQTGEKQLGS